MTKKELFDEIEKKCLRNCAVYDRCVSCLESSGNTDQTIECQDYITRCREQWK